MSERGDVGFRLEWLAVAWGAILPWIALIASAELSELLRVGAVVPAFLIGGFFAGVRASQRRLLHGALVGPLAVLLGAAFALATRAAHAVGASPDPLAIAPGGWMASMVVLIVGTVAAVLGAYWAALRLSSGGSTRLGIS